MTDKQIIIDGVDVSKGNEKFIKNHEWYKAELNTVDGINLAECVHFTRQYDYGYCELSNDSCNQFRHDCKLNKNCYYKQLKIKEQECEKLINKNNLLETELNQIKLLLDGKNTQYLRKSGINRGE